MSDERSAVMSLRILHNTLKVTVTNLMDKRSRRCAGEDKYLDGQLDAYAQCFSMVDACMMHLTAPHTTGEKDE